MSTITISAAVQEQLRSALLEGQDLVGGLSEEAIEPDPLDEEQFSASLTLAVRRPFDPETAELRDLVVKLRRVGDDLEIFEVSGLES